jgi:Tfp pilus assembly protein PilP
LQPFLYAQDKKVETVQIKDANFNSFEYIAKGKRDPFMPLILKPEAGHKKIFDPLMLKLVGILWDNSTYYAVLGFPDGKYYNLKENSRLGIYDAYVFKIHRDFIIIREHIKIKKGAIKTKDTILKLRKEEEG